jgi:Phage integrase family
MRAERRSERTIDTYREALEQLSALLHDRGRRSAMPRRPTSRTTSSTSWSAAGPRPPTTASAPCTASTAGSRTRRASPNPMARLEPPAVPEEPVPVLDDHASAAVRDLPGGRAAGQRDPARVPRCRSAPGGADRDQDGGHRPRRGCHPRRGKGGRPRSLPFGHRTAQALDGYLRVRRKHPRSALPSLWIGKKEALTRSGVSQIVRRRGEEAGIKGLHPHMFRPTPLPIAGAPRAATRPTSCVSPAGTPRRCSATTQLRPPTLAPVRPIAASPRWIASKCFLGVHAA